MDVKPRCYDKVVQLIEKGVNIPNPLTLDIGDEVNPDYISGKDVTLYPGCRIYGEKTVVSGGVKIGHEAPVTIENCQLGYGVELKGGYFNHSIFLEKVSMGSGAQVREGCILEEEANSAHCVGLKQTILFPFVTLGSLINFCDCLMAGGTSRKDHSEVGSSYIHFNYTPDGDKTTASLIGDVPRGVMLNKPPIFLGGQGGIVGPVCIGYGNVVVAGSVLRNDYPEDNKLIVGKVHTPKIVNFTPRTYLNLGRIVANNILYLSNLMALEAWYQNVRSLFFDAQEFGHLLYKGLLDKLMLAKKERIKRLQVLAEKTRPDLPRGRNGMREADGKKEFNEKFFEIEKIFKDPCNDDEIERYGDDFLSLFDKIKRGSETNYVAVIQNLPTHISEKGTLWLQKIVDIYCRKAQIILPALNMFNA